MRVNSISPKVYPVTKINKDKKKQSFQQFVTKFQNKKIDYITECLCDECGQDFPLELVSKCRLNGDDVITKVCKSCCQGCGYYIDGECGF